MALLFILITFFAVLMELVNFLLKIVVIALSAGIIIILLKLFVF